MNIQRFTAATSREALAKARMAFGESTLILSNRPTENGVEVVATAEETLASLDQSPRGSAPGRQATTSSPADESPSYRDVASKVEDDAAQLAMSTLSFQDYVRERMAKRQQEAAGDKPQPAPAKAAPFNLLKAPDPIRVRTEEAQIKPRPSPTSTVPGRSSVSAATTGVSQGIVDELHAMKEMIEDRFNTLSWLGQARQNPIQSNLMLKMIRAGYSPTLSRAILEKMPVELDATESVRWVMDVLEKNLKTDSQGPALHQEGGVFALVGATGVGKTTTAAKLAGICARIHGPGSVGLITLDTYRVGAHEQLRAYGKLLGVVAHLAHDRPALQDLLSLLSGKKMVLIDTTGLAPRDPRKHELMELLDLPGVKKVLVLNTGGQGETLEESVNAFKTQTAQQVIFSKIDETIKLGPAIDVAIRHQLCLRGVANGQRVPEDWESANAANLVRLSMRSGGISAYDPKASDLNFYFSDAGAKPTTRGFLNA